MQNEAISSKRSGLSGNALKVIAILAMTIDHVAWMGIETTLRPKYLYRYFCM